MCTGDLCLSYRSFRSDSWANLRTDCVKYDVLRMNIVNYNISVHTCPICINTTRSCRRTCSSKGGCHTVCRNVCIQYSYPPCYDSNAIADYGGYRQCALRADINEPDIKTALQKAMSIFPLGSAHGICRQIRVMLPQGE